MAIAIRENELYEPRKRIAIRENELPTERTGGTIRYNDLLLPPFFENPRVPERHSDGNSDF